MTKTSGYSKTENGNSLVKFKDSSRGILIFVFLLVLCMSIFFTRFAPLYDHDLYEGLNPEIKKYVDINKVYASNLVLGINGTGVPNSVGTSIIFYPAYYYNLDYMASYLYFLVVVSVFTSMAIFLVYKYFNNLAVSFIYFLYFPASKIMFEFIPSAFPFFIFMVNLTLFTRRKYIPAYVVILFAAFFRPEMIIILIAEIIVEFRFHKNSMIRSSILKFAGFASLYIIVFVASMLFVYGSAGNQLAYNLRAYYQLDTLTMITSAGLLFVFFMFIFFLLKMKEIRERNLYLLVVGGYLLFFIGLFLVRSQAFGEYVRFVSPIFPLVFIEVTLAGLRRHGIQILQPNRNKGTS